MVNAEANSLGIRIIEIVTILVDEISYQVRQDPSILNRSIRNFQEIPDLNWTEIVGTTTYEAVLDGTHFLVNILSGQVLLNGLSHDRLSRSIFGSVLYQSFFGDREFEVSLNEGIYTTLRSIGNVKYQFAEKGSKVMICELNSCYTTVLQLVDYSEEGVWPIDLPIRLRTMYTHWYSEKEQCLLFRPKIAMMTLSVEYIAIFGKKSACYQIPAHLFELKLTSILEIYESFSKLACFNSISMVNILRKFEDTNLTHLLHTESVLKVIFPRYNLSFTMLDGVFLSEDFIGYHLRYCQSWENILPFFTEFLLLESKTGDSKMLVSDGIVYIEASGLCRIDKYTNS